MIAVEPMNPTHLRCGPNSLTRTIASEGERSGLLPAGKPPKVTTRFEPPDSGLVNEAIPTFFIGRNGEGFWVARDARGKTGGIFLFRSSAVAFARRKSRRTGCATIFQSEGFELDVANRGNPLVGPLGQMKRVAIRHRQRTNTLIKTMMRAIRDRLKDSRAP
jgi:hypothetical protein